MPAGLRKPSTDYKGMCMGCFSRSKLGKRMVNGYYSGPVVNENLYSDKNLKTKQGW